MHGDGQRWRRHDHLHHLDHKLNDNDSAGDEHHHEHDKHNYNTAFDHHDDLLHDDDDPRITASVAASVMQEAAMR